MEARWDASAIRLRRPLPHPRQPARHLCRARTRELHFGATVLPLHDAQREPNPRETVGFHHIRRCPPSMTWAFDALHRRKRRNTNFHAMPGGVGFQRLQTRADRASDHAPRGAFHVLWVRRPGPDLFEVRHQLLRINSLGHALTVSPTLTMQELHSSLPAERDPHKHRRINKGNHDD